MANIFDLILEWLVDMVVAVINLLPVSPIQSYNLDFGAFAEVMGWVNYFIPLGAMLGIMGTYIGAVMVWYSIRWVMRITKYIQ